MMADAGLNGAVRRIESGIDFRVRHALTSTQTIDGAAQCIWTLFDVVASLTEAGHCDGVVDVAVTISVTGPRDETTIEAYVMLSDLMDFHRQVLNEGEFIDRVDYSVTPVQAQSTP
ncbi:MAG: hypothetical protein GX620_08450 [Chloroflexi bacterium]|nr:hypothetical protein [Chloroflexota bacterium]